MSGYLLSGGMSWNHGVWGPGVGSIEAIEMVTADGKLVTASRDENAELFWAARGAGPGFFAVALRYHLRLYHRPRAIASSSYTFPVEKVIKIAEWLGPLADELEPKVELSLFMIAAPDSLAEQFDLRGGKVCMVTATVFADSSEEAESALRPLEGCPYMGNCLSRSFAEPSTFEQLFDASGALWPAKLRARVDAMLSNVKLSDVVASVADHYVECPSKETVLMYAVYTGGSAPATPPDAAFSMTGKLYGGPWTMWRSPGEDASNIAWHTRCVELLLPLMHGHYISESDTVGHPEYVKSSYLGDSLSRIEELRRKYDPKGVFVGFQDEGPATIEQIKAGE
jgi:FAD/FMN-containing dehydrogenase